MTPPHTHTLTHTHTYTHPAHSSSLPPRIPRLRSRLAQQLHAHPRWPSTSASCGPQDRAERHPHLYRRFLILINKNPLFSPYPFIYLFSLEKKL
jgi:hypothetical protein